MLVHGMSCVQIWMRIGADPHEWKCTPLPIPRSTNVQTATDLWATVRTRRHSRYCRTTRTGTRWGTLRTSRRGGRRHTWSCRAGCPPASGARAGARCPRSTSRSPCSPRPRSPHILRGRSTRILQCHVQFCMLSTLADVTQNSLCPR